jgi:regulator of protease activity HflC (stomatin/prohibitin superfamily)
VVGVFGTGLSALAQTPGETSPVTGRNLSVEEAEDGSAKNIVANKTDKQAAKPKKTPAKEEPVNPVVWFLFGILLFFALVLVVTSTKIIPQGYAGVVERLGRYVRTEGPGLIFKAPIVGKVRFVSLKGQVDEYTHHVITSDKVLTTIGVVVFFQVVDAADSVYKIQSYLRTMETQTMTILQHIIGDMGFDECLKGRDRINARLRMDLDTVTSPFGIKVTAVEIKTIEPPKDLIEAMAAQQKAQITKQAAITEAEGIKASAVTRAEGSKESAILEAQGEREAAVLKAQGRAKAYEELFGALRKIGIDDKVIAIRYLEALEKIADGQASKLFLPYEASGVLSALSGIADIFKKEGGPGPEGVAKE